MFVAKRRAEKSPFQLSFCVFFDWETLFQDGTWNSSGKEGRWNEADLLGELPTGEVGGWNETMERFRALWRCGIPFAMARYGDGELSVMKSAAYKSETDIVNWSFLPSENMETMSSIRNLMMDGFRLAAENSEIGRGVGGMYVGLPLSFCAEGSTQDFSYGGGGHFDWLVEYLTVVNEKSSECSSEQNGVFMAMWEF